MARATKAAARARNLHLATSFLVILKVAFGATVDGFIKGEENDHKKSRPR